VALVEVEEFPLVLHQEFLTQVRLRLLRLQERRLDMAVAEELLLLQLATLVAQGYQVAVVVEQTLQLEPKQVEQVVAV
jgi:hypothetical protein